MKIPIDDDGKNNDKEEEEEEEKKNNKKSVEKSVDVERFYPMDDNLGGIYSPNVYVFRGSQFSGYEIFTIK